MLPEPAQNDRRGHLASVANTAWTGDMLIAFRGPLAAGIELELCYVPDRLLLERPAFSSWCAALGASRWGSLELLAATALADVNDVLVPRWARIAIRGDAHAVLLEDSQPQWSNPTLLAAVREL